MREIDFTACPRIHSRAYNGANGKKIAVSFEGSVWMLKFPPSAADKPNDLSYSNSCISEHLGSTVFRLLGVPAQETRLGTHVNGRRKIVCACRDFTVPGVRFYDFCSIKNTVIDSETGGHGTELAYNLPYCYAHWHSRAKHGRRAARPFSAAAEISNSLRPQPPCAGNGLTCANEFLRSPRLFVRQNIQLL